MIKAVIFDCFGVLTTDGWLPFKQRHFAGDAALLQQATDLNKQVDAGLADYDEFIYSVAELAQVPVQDARTAIEDNVANEELFRFIREELRPQYGLGFLSNAGANWLDKLFSKEQVALFDAISLSCESGFVKPDERAYRAVANVLGVKPEECIFVDDQPRYCTAAQDVGMQAITYTDFPSFETSIRELLA